MKKVIIPWHEIERPQISLGRTKELLRAWGWWAYERPQGWYSCANPIHKYMQEAGSTERRKRTRVMPPENDLLAIDSAIAHFLDCKCFDIEFSVLIDTYFLNASQRDIAGGLGISRALVRDYLYTAESLICGAYPLHKVITETRERVSK